MLHESGEIDPWAGGTAVYDPEGRYVGWRKTYGEGKMIGTVLREEAPVPLNDGAELEFTSADLEDGFTAAWHTTVDREPLE